MRLGETPVPIPNTTVKTRAADGTMLETISSISTSNWGTLTHVALYDAATGGNMFASMSLGRSYSVPMGTAVGFHAYDLQFTIS